MTNKLFKGSNKMLINNININIDLLKVKFDNLINLRSKIICRDLFIDCLYSFDKHLITVLFSVAFFLIFMF